MSIVFERLVNTLFEKIWPYFRKVLKTVFLLTISAVYAVVRMCVPTEMRSDVKHVW
jgi:hypothetical protein